VMGHVDRGILTMDDYRRMADLGCVLEFDQFGWGCSYQHAINYGIQYPDGQSSPNPPPRLFYFLLFFIFDSSNEGEG